MTPKQQQLSRYESEENRITAGYLFYLARGFELPISWFFEGFQVTQERKRHLENVIHGPLSPEYHSATPSEMTATMLALWDTLPNNNQRQKTLERLEVLTGSSRFSPGNHQKTA